MEDRRPPVVVPDEANAWEAVSMVPDGGVFYRGGGGGANLAGGIRLPYRDGFTDAGGGGGLLPAHLRGSRAHGGVVPSDVAGLIDYRPRRPPMTYDKDHW